MTDPFDGRVAFVTGATGFLGYAIARSLASRGARVRALVRGTSLPGELSARGVAMVPGDLNDVDALARGMHEASYVFHVAADVRMTRDAWPTSLATNVEGTRTMLRAARAAGVARFVFTSSGSTLGKPLSAVRGPVVRIDETCAYNFHDLGWVYPHTKWMAEELVLEAARDGLSAVVTHPTAIFGPWDWKHNLLPLLRAPGQALGWVTTGGFRTVCDVRDVADAHLEAAVRGRSGERYALAGEPMSVRALQTAIAEEIGGHAPRVELPPGLVRGLGRAFDLASAITGRPPPLSEEMAMQSCLRVEVSSAKAERELGYRSRPARESIADTVAWYRASGLLG